MESPLCLPAEPDFRLIETLGYHPGHGLVRQQRHFARMARTASALGLPFSREQAEDAVRDLAGQAPLRCRLTMDATGRFDLTTTPLAANPPVWRVAVATQRLESSDVWLRHKTTRRKVYDTARASMPPGLDELLFLNERDQLCEGTITNLFVVTENGECLTPALSSGLLPGILREALLEDGSYSEGTLTLNDLHTARAIHVGNSLRGLIPIELVDL